MTAAAKNAKAAPSKRRAAKKPPKAAAIAQSLSVDEVSRRAAERARNVAPASMRHEVHAESFQVGQDSPRDMPTSGPAELEERRIEVVDGPSWKDHAAALAFMEEKIEVTVHDTTDKNESKIVEVWVDGRSQRFLRNHPAFVRRKFVEALGRAKNTSFTQQHYKDGEGYDAIRNDPHTALRYPFSVGEDRNPNGRAWLRQLLAEA